MAMHFVWNRWAIDAGCVGCSLQHLTVNNHPVPTNIINLTVDPDTMTIDNFIQSLAKSNIYIKKNLQQLRPPRHTPINIDK